MIADIHLEQQKNIDKCGETMFVNVCDHAAAVHDQTFQYDNRSVRTFDLYTSHLTNSL